MGGYLKRAHQGDIEHRDRVRFERADEVTQGGHAFRVIAVYERWLQAAIPTGRGEDARHGPRQLAVLRLLGLFDRTASANCLAALRQHPPIEGLTDQLVGLDEEDWNIAVHSLVDLGLISNDEGTLDAHPLVREYFAARLRDEDAAAWTEGHRRLFEHLCAATEHRPDTLDGLQPLYQAIAHGCQAGLHQWVCVDVYRDRILRGTGSAGFYSLKRLGAMGADLGAVACFFEQPWSKVSPNLSPADQAWLLSMAAHSLRVLGRLTEAVEPMRAGLEMRIKDKNWKNAAISTSNLSELELTLGEVSFAVTSGAQSVDFADRSTDAFRRLVNRTRQAAALHHAGRREEARERFAEAERMQVERQTEYPRLYSLQGFLYCDLLLSEAERTAWQRSENPGFQMPDLKSLQATCDDVTERATQTLEWARDNNLPLLTIALDHLTLGRAALYRAVLAAVEFGAQNEESDSSHSEYRLPRSAHEELDTAVDGLRQAGQMDHLPRGLLSRAWCRFLHEDRAGCEVDLAEAEDLSARGPMPLFLADVHLTRARLFRDRQALDQATELLKHLQAKGYHRRDEELADAEAEIRTEGNRI